MKFANSDRASHGVRWRAACRDIDVLLQVDKLAESDAMRSEEEQKAEEKPLVFSKWRAPSATASAAVWRSINDWQASKDTV